MQSQLAITLYRTIWRWHFYAGMFCLPFVLLLALSGTIYLFKPQIDAWVDKPFQNLEVGAQRSNPNQQIDTALNAVPNSKFLNYQLPTSENQAVVVSVNQNGERISVYINPYTLDVLKVVGYNDQFIRVVRTFHGELLAGNFGSVLVELAGCWAIVLILTGLYLWWPRNVKGFGGVLYPRLRSGGRIFWRDLHAVIGIWISAFALFLLVTGLPWALVWGSAFQEVRSWSSPSAAQQQDWTVSRAEEHGHLMAQNAQTDNAKVDLTPQLLTSVQALNIAPPVELSIDNNGHESVWVSKSDHQNRMLRSNAWFDASGNVLRVETFSDKLLLDRAIGIGVAAHEGQLFGWFNQLLGLLTTTGLVLMCVSAFVLWRKRKPQGALGAPAALPNMTVGKVIALVVFVTALFLPLLAISLVVLFLLEKLVLSRLQALGIWFGIRAD